MNIKRIHVESAMIVLFTVLVVNSVMQDSWNAAYSTGVYVLASFLFLIVGFVAIGFLRECNKLERGLALIIEGFVSLIHFWALMHQNLTGSIGPYLLGGSTVLVMIATTGVVFDLSRVTK